jgi:hypothetical protein
LKGVQRYIDPLWAKAPNPTKEPRLDAGLHG